MLLEESNPEGAVRVAGRISEDLRAPFPLGGPLTGVRTVAGDKAGEEIVREAFASVSVGIALSGPDRKVPGQLLREADLAMYRAKAQGKARHAVFEEGMDERATRRLEAENKLRRAIARGELVVHYEPKVSIKGGEIVGMEALGVGRIPSAASSYRLSLSPWRRRPA